MSNTDLVGLEALQGLSVPIGTNLVHMQAADGSSKVCTMEQLSNFLTGVTIAVGRQDAHMGAVVQLTDASANIALTDSPISFAREVSDTHGFWSPSNPSRIYIPPGLGITKVKISLFADLVTENGGAGYVVVALRKNGVATDVVAGRMKSIGAHEIPSFTLTVADNDYFEWVLANYSALEGDFDVSSANSYTEIVVIENTI